jgi:hypothetical protein
MTDHELLSENDRQPEKEKWYESTRYQVLLFVGGLALFVLVGGLILDWYINPQTSGQKKDLVQALGLLTAGVAGAGGIYFTWRGQRLTQQAQEENRRNTQQQLRNTQEQLKNTQEELRLKRACCIPTCEEPNSKGPYSIKPTWRMPTCREPTFRELVCMTYCFKRPTSMGLICKMFRDSPGGTGKGKRRQAYPASLIPRAPGALGRGYLRNNRLINARECMIFALHESSHRFANF